MNRYLDQLEAVARAARVGAGPGFRWFDAPSPRLPARMLPTLSPEALTDALIASLADRLYRDFYCAGGARPRLAEQPLRDTGRGRLAPAMSRANRGRGTWEDGWTVDQVQDGMVAADRNGLRLWLGARDYVATDHLRARVDPRRQPTPEVGDQVAVRLPAESLHMSPGYYYALSDAPFPYHGTEALLRVYLDLRPDAAPQAVGAVTGRLNAAGVPFRFKVLTDEQGYRRVDTAVLYVLRSDLRQVRGPLTRIVDDLSGALRPPVPALTKQLAPGVAVADDPGDGASYGQHRCEVIARGLVHARGGHRRGWQPRLAAILEAFETARIDPHRPYLAPGAEDDVDLAPRPVPAARRVPAPAPADADADADAPEREPQRLGLHVATTIGRQLTDSAVEHDGRCTWLGLVPAVDDLGRPELAYGTVNPSLYDGLAGIALFLAVLGSLTADPVALGRARAAARQALCALDPGGPADRGARPDVRTDAHAAPALHTGAVGVALAASAVGIVTHEPELGEHARAVVGRSLTLGLPPLAFDLLGGAAGAAVGLLGLAALHSDDDLAGAAVRMGELLLAGADRTDGGWSWRSDAQGRRPGLTGLSHGTAGVATALVELFRATGDRRWASAAREAVRYEQAAYDPEVMNWRDLREDSGRPRAGARGTFVSQWCHGAPGIALARIRAAQLLGDDDLAGQARVALLTTARDTATALRETSLGYSLCHGLAGNADVLLTGLTDAQALAPRDELWAVVTDVAEAGLIRHVTQGRPWPCGLPALDRQTPGLFIGTSGIGYHYLRLAYPREVPSVLSLRPLEFAHQIAELGRRTVGTALPRQLTGALPGSGKGRP